MIRKDSLFHFGAYIKPVKLIYSQLIEYMDDKTNYILYLILYL